jgi:exodeoxyribonuclease V alpha subunit
MPQELTGVLTHLAIHGQWGRGTVVTSGGRRVAVTGKALLGLKKEETYRLVGQERRHPKFGTRFEVSLAQIDVAPGQGVLKFLQKHYANVGEKTASAIVDWYARAGGGIDALRSALALRPWEIEGCPAVGARKVTYLDEIGSSPEERLHRRLAAEVAGARVSDVTLKRLAVWMWRSFGKHQDSPVEACWERFKADPYEAVGMVEGYGFGAADSIAVILKLGRTAPCRLLASLEQAIKAGCEREGHVFLTEEQAGYALKQIDAGLNLGECLKVLPEDDRRIVVREGRLYEAGMHRTESFVAGCIADMLEPAMPLWVASENELEERIKRLESAKGDKFCLDESQRAAIKGIVMSTARIHTLTAPPGRGKTAVMEMLAGLIGNVIFAAPTGKAAKVLTGSVERHGMVAQTTHAMLQANGERFKKCRGNQLVGNMVVLDEGGMSDLLTFAGCLDALGPHTHLLVVGDIDQLEAVGRGCVLNDLMRTKNVDRHVLTQDHRSSSGILKLLESIRRGEMPEQPPGTDVEFIGREPGFDFKALVNVWAEAANRNGLESVGLLFAHRRGSPEKEDWNVTFANSEIQELVNPMDHTNQIPGLKLRVGDRVILRKNVTLTKPGHDGRDVVTGQVVNGDTGYLVGYGQFKEGGPGEVEVELDEGRTIELGGEQIRALELAYGQTVHSAQGSEFAEVIFVAPKSVSEFANRRIFLTAASRARRKLKLVGAHEVFAAMAARAPRDRNSFIPELVASIRAEREK